MCKTMVAMVGWEKLDIVQFPALSKKDDWQGFALQNGSGKKAIWAEVLQNAPGFFYTVSIRAWMHVLDHFFREHLKMVAGSRSPRQLTGNTIL